MFVVLTIIVYLFWSHIFDILFSTNKTQILFPLMTEYFVDQEKYSFLISLHANIALIIGGVAMLAIGTIMLVYQKYACGMFRIARYKNKHKNRSKKIKKIERNIIITKNYLQLSYQTSNVIKNFAKK